MLGLQGCAPHQAAAFDAWRQLSPFAAKADPSQGPLNPHYRYLRVTVNAQTVLMVLGYVDMADSEAPVQIWYSGAGEVLRLRHGRLAGLVGSPTEWRDVRWPQGTPGWGAALRQPSSYERVLDQMPGYHLGMVQSLRIEAVPMPRDTAWAGPVSADLRWFRESVSSGALPAALYAVRMRPEGAEPVYGEQCVAANLCLTWQTWPPHQEPRT